nr:histidine kinase [uncultured Sphingobacterium sp.]
MKLKDFRKVEFWLATLLFILFSYNLVSDTNQRNDGGIHEQFIAVGISYSYFFNFFVPKFLYILAFYLSFLALNFMLIPTIIDKKSEALNYSLIVLLIVVVSLVLGISKTYSHTYELLGYKTIQQGYNRLFFDAFNKTALMVILISVYTCGKYFIAYLLKNMDGNTTVQRQMKTDLAFGIGFWFVGLFLWITSRSNFQFAILWTMVVLSAVGIVIYSLYYLLPELYRQQKKFVSYFWNIFVISLVLMLPLCILALFFFNRTSEVIFIVALFHLPTQLLVSIPLSWFLYKKRVLQNSELTSLRTELGKSDANLNFLKSQINPHFLFNALNTLYGTALQEKAERTGAGIQQLGDMMRFMLHENTQDKISLIREVEYLNNYIALQTLRTSQSAGIKIETLIEEQFENYQITPMLLIPFVENAFKHGISLQKPSYIKISLQVRGNVLFFDVSNSINLKNDNDPEKLKSGVGLDNVRKRLLLLYKNRHELIIRENAQEFFVHLTLHID